MDNFDGGVGRGEEPGKVHGLGKRRGVGKRRGGGRRSEGLVAERRWELCREFCRSEGKEDDRASEGERKRREGVGGIADQVDGMKSGVEVGYGGKGLDRKSGRGRSGSSAWCASRKAGERGEWFGGGDRDWSGRRSWSLREEGEIGEVCRGSGEMAGGEEMGRGWRRDACGGRAAAEAAQGRWQQ